MIEKLELFSFDSAFEKMMEQKDLKTVVILAHINPDGDAAGSVMSLSHYIRCNYPSWKVIPHLSEKLDKGPKKMILKDTHFKPFEKPDLADEAYGVIVCDTATMERIAGKEYYDGAAASIVLDHHASNEGYGDVNCRVISESCSENIFYILDPDRLRNAVNMGNADQPGLNAAEYIYLGMLHDTDGFDRAKITTMEAACELQKLGVDHKELMKTLKTETFEDMQKRMQLLSSAVRVMDGKVAYVFVDRKESEEKDIQYADIHAISGLLRDCEDIELGFTFYEEEPGLWRCSFRSDGKWINVNELMRPFGGGGHAGAAGLRKRSDQPEVLIQDILKRVCEMRSESHIS